MDIYCRHCGEAWDHDSLHEQAEYTGLTYEFVAKEFRKNGCSALGSVCNGNNAKKEIGILYDVLGNDMDAAASMLEEI